MVCSTCQHKNPIGAKFCNACGAKLEQTCPSCSRINPPGSRFCNECGSPLTSQSSVEEPASKQVQGPAPKVQRQEFQSLTLRPQSSAAERRQLTVMFCDLVGSTALSVQLDPEELREVVRAYHETCAGVISRYAGHTAQHLGDGLLVYFGHPVAHEDDAQRAIRTGLEILAGLQSLNAQLPPTIRARLPHPIQVRIGVHTGLVVIGEIGSSEKREMLALGETPNIAARVQGVAEPDTVVMSAATHHLVHGLFECQDCGRPELKGISTPLTLYRVVKEGEAQSRFEVAVHKGLTPLVGRAEELALLQRRWEHAKAGAGQVVLVNGEAGIGKSRLVQTFKEQVLAEGATRIEFRCSPYHQNSAFYSIIEHLHRLLQFRREDTPQTKLTKLQQVLGTYRFPQADTLLLLATLLSLPQPEGIPPLTLSPQKQKQKTQEALVAWILEEAQQAMVYCAWEDVHWADPSTLEVLTLFLEQIPTTRVFSVLTFRPDFTPPWSPRSYLTQLTLSRLGRSHVEAMIEQCTDGKSLPLEVLQQIVTKTDGVPLFVEEITKSVIEAQREQVTGDEGRDDGGRGRPPAAFAFQIGIPATLQDALMARLDRLGTAKEVAQQGSVVGRELTYELIRAISPLTEVALEQELSKLVEAELLYQRGRPPQATYLFKHALVQETAYQSLLKSKRQQYHQQIAQVLEERFPETKETQQELLAQHYTEAGLITQAVPYWQKAGQRSTQRSAYVEAVAHLTKGLELLKILPDTPVRVQQELTLQTTLGTTLLVTKGYAAPEVEQSYARALELCRQLGETPQLLLVLGGLYTFHFLRADLRTAQELAEQRLRLAQSLQDPALLLGPHVGLGLVLCNLGESTAALVHLERGIALYDPPKHRPDRSQVYGQDPKVTCLSYAAVTLWTLGYPDQARQRITEALTLAQELSHPFSLAFALNLAAALDQSLRDRPAVQERTEALLTLAREQGFPHWLALGAIRQGWVLAEQGEAKEGVARMRQGRETMQAMGAALNMPLNLAWLAEGYGKTGQAEEGLTLLAEALELVQKTGERRWEAELYRLKGTLTLQSKVEEEAEECFHKAIEIASQQQAKSLELRATTSLARFWQQQGKKKEAYELLAPVYAWFTEGFDTKDLQEAKSLLEALT